MSSAPPPPDSNQPPRVPISKRLVLINMFSIVVTRFLTFTVFAWAITYIGNRVPAKEMALIPVVMSVALVIPLAYGFLTTGLERFVTEAYARNDTHRVTQIATSTFPFLLAGSVVLMLFGAFLCWKVLWFLDIAPELVSSARFMIALVFLRLSIGLTLVGFNTGLYTRQMFLVRNAIEITGSLLQIILMVVMLIVVAPRAHWVLFSQVVSQIWVAVVASIISAKVVPALRIRRGAFSWPVAKEIFVFGGWYTLGQVATAIREAADSPILLNFGSAIAVNAMFYGAFVDQGIRRFGVILNRTINPVLTAMHATDQKARLANAFLRGGRIQTWFAMSVASPLIVFAESFYRLYLGDAFDQYSSAPTVLVILLLTYPTVFPLWFLWPAARAIGDVRPVMVRSVTIEAFNLLLTLVLVGYFQAGAIGAASATLVSSLLLRPALQWTYALQLLDLSWRRFLLETVVPGVLPAVSAIAIGFLFKFLVPATDMLPLGAGVLVCLVVYCASAIAVLQPADRADLQHIRARVPI